MLKRPPVRRLKRSKAWRATLNATQTVKVNGISAPRHHGAFSQPIHTSFGINFVEVTATTPTAQANTKV